jgi:hypothetical protein
MSYRKTITAKPLPGFPWKDKFKTMEEVDEYFDRDKITCLVCGRDYISLHKHLLFTHDMTPETYKESFGLPWRRGLISRLLKEKQGAIMNRQRKDGILPQAPSAAHIRRLRKSIANRRPTVDAVRENCRQHALGLHGRSEKWSDADFEEYLRRVKTGRTLTEVGRDKDMPCREVFDKWLRLNPAFRVKFEKLWDSLPFDLQVRGQRTGKRFKKTVFDLRRQGKTWPEISRIMGVKEGTVRGCWHRKAHQRA